MSSELPYRAEYSKSGRAKCKGCKMPIEKDVLRLAAMVQSPFFDGKQPNWFHEKCFFVKQRPQTVGDIAHYDMLRWDDQERIKEKVGGGGGAGPSPAQGKEKGKSKAKKRSATSSAIAGVFKAEYSKSSRARCRGCEEIIVKDEVRISKKDFESEEGRRYGGMDMWHHVTCFAEVRDELGFWESGVMLPGYKDLSADDQKLIKQTIPKAEPKLAVKDEVDGPSGPKKMKEESNGSAAKGSESKCREQNKIMFKYRDVLKDALNKKQLVELLKYNKQDIPAGEEKMLDRLSDAMAFGVVAPCAKCSGQYVYRSGVGYQCQGDLTEWVKCQDINTDPKRIKFRIPDKIKEENSSLAKYKCKIMKRELILNAPSATATSGTSMVDGKSVGPKVHRPPPPLKNMQVVILGKTNTSKDELKTQITKMGGRVVTKIHDKLAFVISNLDELDKMNTRMEDVKDADIQVVSEDFLEEAKDTSPDSVLLMIKKKSICGWGSDPKTRVVIEDPTKSVSRFGKSSSMFTKSVPTKMKLQLKGGAYVDPDSGLENIAHVYKQRGEYWNTVLGLTDIQSNKNKFYKMQILESDGGSSFWFFRSWGRIGTTIGGNKVEKSSSLQDAMLEFEKHYLEKSGNKWKNRKNFVKIPGLMYPIDVDYGEDEPTVKKIAESSIQSKLPEAVQELVKMLFDVETMKKVMLEFELDLEKMPLGKISQKQMTEGYLILQELQKALTNNASSNVFLGLSNRFYTLIPHSFGIDAPPILNTDEQIKQKIDMLSSLMEIEIAYSLLGSGSVQAGESPVDTHYKKLKTDISVLDKTTEEFAMLQKYVVNTHADTHTQYSLEIDEIFKVSRKNEAKRYKGYKTKLTNRKLLWHGSRVTNFAGILSQGLRIAPPEAPVTGYMFGKGIYFADMVSKSANYCCTSKANPTGLLLLCEVALGEMCERLQAESFVKPPPGFHSVKGVGMTEPDPEAAHVTSDGVHVPLGSGKPTDKQSSLLYNEYIVYDTNQLEIQYLLKMKFKHKY